jgi:hypothetical protein
MAIELEDLQKDGCEENAAGIPLYVFYAYMDDIEAFPVSIPANFEGIGSYAGDFVFKSGKFFHRLYCTLETGDLTAELAGPRDGKSFANQLAITHPGNRAEAIGFAELVKNQDLLFVVPNMNGGYRVVGTPVFPARLDTSSITSGRVSGDSKNFSFVFEAKGRAAKHYAGAVKLTSEPYIEGDYIDDGYFEEQ